MKFKFLTKILVGLILSINFLMGVATAGLITFDQDVNGLTSFSQDIVINNSKVQASAIFSNPFTETAFANNVASSFFSDVGSNPPNKYLVIGTGNTTLSWDVLFSENVTLQAITIGKKLINNRGFNISGKGVNVTELLSGLDEGTHAIGDIQFQKNEIYTFKSVSEVATTGFGGIRFKNLVFSDDNFKVPEPSTLAIFALGLMGLASRRLKK